MLAQPPMDYIPNGARLDKTIWSPIELPLSHHLNPQSKVNHASLGAQGEADSVMAKLSPPEPGYGDELQKLRRA